MFLFHFIGFHFWMFYITGRRKRERYAGNVWKNIIKKYLENILHSFEILKSFKFMEASLYLDYKHIWNINLFRLFFILFLFKGAKVCVWQNLLILSLLKDNPTRMCSWARDLKNSRKYGSGLSYRWVLFTAWAFRFKFHLILNRVSWKNRFNIRFGGFSC